MLTIRFHFRHRRHRRAQGLASAVSNVPLRVPVPQRRRALEFERRSEVG